LAKGIAVFQATGAHRKNATHFENSVRGFAATLCGHAQLIPGVWFAQFKIELTVKSDFESSKYKYRIWMHILNFNQMNTLKYCYSCLSILCHVNARRHSLEPTSPPVWLIATLSEAG
ncbi:MAG: hypothetical protein MN733_34690, partial [Nitrososphaera sp.]|nr:hypothetical protein [Nitrososphaera sp.]